MFPARSFPAPWELKPLCEAPLYAMRPCAKVSTFEMYRYGGDYDPPLVFSVHDWKNVDNDGKVMYD